MVLFDKNFYSLLRRDSSQKKFLLARRYTIGASLKLYSKNWRKKNSGVKGLIFIQRIE